MLGNIFPARSRCLFDSSSTRSGTASKKNVFFLWFFRKKSIPKKIRVFLFAKIHLALLAVNSANEFIKTLKFN